MMGTFSLCLVMTANRTVETIEEATVCIKDMDVFLCQAAGRFSGSAAIVNDM